MTQLTQEVLKRTLRSPTVERQSISEAALLEILLQETTSMLGKDASFLGKQVEFRRSKGEPNWDASCGIANPMIVKAFVTAVVKAQAHFNLD
jgi:hypothetical protein